ncbi:MAG: ABC-2 family transporter protein [Spirochaetes bacterium]|nr:ABC-2 family transporter protein [Spirochaetota bacterium]
MRRFLEVYLAFFKQQIKSLIEYKVDFALGMLALAFQQLSSFLVLFAVFTQIKSIGSYSFDEMLLFYGFSQILRGVDHIYNDNIWTVGWMRIRNGTFSQYLTRPIPVLSQVIMERVQFDGFGELLLGLLVFVYAKVRLALVFTPMDWLVFGAFCITGLAIYFAIKLACSAVAFWTVSSGELMTVVYEVNTFTRYPLDIYKSAILRNLLIYFLPFAVVSYFPMVYFLRDNIFISSVLGINYDNRIFILIFSVTIAAAALLLASTLWRRGMRRYNASGT